MRTLSNILLFPEIRRRAAGEETAALEIRAAQESEIEPALRLILGTGARPAGDEQVVDFLRFALQRGIDVKHLWVASRDRRIVWGILPVTSPGKTMLLFSPSHVSADVANAARCLIEAILADFAARGVQLAQVLLEPGCTVTQLFSAARFGQLAELIYLQRDLRTCPAASLPPAMTLRNYSPSSHADFARAIIASYRGSLDCPPLNGMRGIEDVIAGHKAAGDFDPRLWFLLFDRDEPCAVLLLARSGRCETIELVYLGLAPEARGKGIGDLMMRHALHVAADEGAEKISLAVDSGNAPALRLYQRHGMQRVCSRLALIRQLDR